MFKKILAIMSGAFVIVSLIIGSGCTSSSKTKLSRSDRNSKQAKLEKRKKATVVMPVKYNLLSASNTKNKQHFRYFLNGPVEVKHPKNGNSYFIIDLEYANPNASKFYNSYKGEDFKLKLNGVLSDAEAYQWNGSDQIQFDARNMSQIDTSTGYWSKIYGGTSNLDGNETRGMKIMFEIPNNSFEQIVLQIKGKQYSIP